MSSTQTLPSPKVRTTRHSKILSQKENENSRRTRGESDQLEFSDTDFKVT